MFISHPSGLIGAQLSHGTPANAAVFLIPFQFFSGWIGRFFHVPEKKSKEFSESAKDFPTDGLFNNKGIPGKEE